MRLLLLVVRVMRLLKRMRLLWKSKTSMVDTVNMSYPEVER